MDASRLVAEAEDAMRGSPQPEQVVAEAWQACELTEAVGQLIGSAHARSGGGGGSGECGGRPVVRAGPATVVAATGTRPPRAVRLTGVRDPAGVLRALRVLLGGIGIALASIAGAAADETAYWQCIEALDAVDEAKDRVRALAGEVGDRGGV